MLYVRARLRYLAALGLPAFAAPMFACSGGTTTTGTTPSGTETTTATVTIGANETTTDTATGTGTETETASATETTTSTTTVAKQETWVPAKDPRIQSLKGPPRASPILPPTGSCPKGLICHHVPAPTTATKAGAAQYAECGEAPPGTTQEDAHRGMTHFTFQSLVTAEERKTQKDACCYEWVSICPGGRPLRAEYGEILAAPAARGDWLARIGEVDFEGVSAADRAFAAAHFEREAAFEHASIAAFSRASLALLAMGAPSDLLADTHAAAIDEVEHARAAFALASALRGASVGPSRLDVVAQAPLPCSLSELAVETFLDACVGESVAALALREAATVAQVGVIGALLARIAEDEERHAALAWRTVAWAVREGGEPVREALQSALSAVRGELHHEEAAAGGDTFNDVALKNGAFDGGTFDNGAIHDGARGVPALGILGGRALAAVRARALREVVLPCAEALLTFSERTGDAVMNVAPMSDISV